MDTKITGRDFLIFGQQAYDNPIGSNCIDIAEEIARNNRVMYVNFPLDRKTILDNKDSDLYLIESRKKVLKGNLPELQQVKENLWVFNPKITIESINLLPDGFMFDLFNKRNNRLIAKRVKKGIRELGFKDYIIFNDSDIFRSFYMKELLRPEVYVYYSRDNLMTVNYFRKHGLRLEPMLMKKATMTAANSVYLKDMCAEHNSNSFYIGQGCDLSLFDAKKEYETPNEFKSLRGPKIGYIGSLRSSRLDITLLETLALKNPTWNILLVGPEDEAFQNSELHEMENVLFTGSKSLDTLPAYLSSFDVAINPQAVNPVTIGNYPRKIDEYLALGIPTVATKTRAMEIFKDHVYLAETAEDYQNMIQEALDKDSKELRQERIEFAKSHTWENSVDMLYTYILKFL